MRVLIKSHSSSLSTGASPLAPTAIAVLRNAMLLWDPEFRGTHQLPNFRHTQVDSSTLLDLLGVVPISSAEPENRSEWNDETEDLVTTLNDLAVRHALEHWPKPVLPGPRDVAYSQGLFDMVRLAAEIEIYDPYFADKLLKHQKQLWLVSKLVEDSPAKIKIITREPRDLKESRAPELEKRNYEASLENLISQTQRVSCSSFEVVIKRFDPSIKVHNRAIRFLFSNGVACDHALENGIEAFGRDRIEDSELPSMANEAFSARRARWRLVKDKYLIVANLSR